MDLRRVLLPQAGRLTSKNASTDQRPQALGRLSRARFATQSATQFDLALAGAGSPTHDAESAGHRHGVSTTAAEMY
jgi:hypothetical protein